MHSDPQPGLQPDLQPGQPSGALHPFFPREAHTRGYAPQVSHINVPRFLNLESFSHVVGKVYRRYKLRHQRRVADVRSRSENLMDGHGLGGESCWIRLLSQTPRTSRKGGWFEVPSTYTLDLGGHDISESRGSWYFGIKGSRSAFKMHKNVSKSFLLSIFLWITVACGESRQHLLGW